jgi:signal transduction histidine kinase
MEQLLRGPWDEDYYLLRCRIGRVHVRISLPQHYMFGAMNLLRQEFNRIIDEHYAGQFERMRATREALEKILDLELAIMLHTYREDLLIQQARNERLSTFGQLVGSIGHELRNPLGVIETSLFILKNRRDRQGGAVGLEGAGGGGAGPGGLGAGRQRIHPAPAVRAADDHQGPWDWPGPAARQAHPRAARGLHRL